MMNRLRHVTMVWVAAVMTAALVGGSGLVHAQAAKGKAEAATPAGAWDGTAETPQGPQAFTLTLKVDSGKVTGDITLPEGTVQLSGGSWEKDELKLAFEHPSAGPVNLSGAFKEDKLAGTYTLNSGEGGGWQAARKTAAK